MRYLPLALMLASLLPMLALGACDGSAGEDDPDVMPTNPRDGGADAPAGSGDAAGDLARESRTCEGDAGDCWMSLTPLPERPRFYVGVAAARGQVFVVGGFAANDVRSVHAYDPAAGTWSALPLLPQAFRMPNVAAVGTAGAERLLVLGAQENKETLEYDFATQMWKTLAAAPVARGRGAAAVGVHGTRVLLAGGVLPGQSANMLNTGERVSELLAYDTQANTWEMLPPLPVANGYSMGAVLGDEFWVIGGSTNFARTEEVVVFNVTTKQWSSKPSLPLSLSSAAVAILRGRVYLAGGIATAIGTISPDTLVLNPTTGVWTTAAPMQVARFGMGAAVINDRMYVPTGIAARSNAPNDFAASPAMEVYIP